MSGLGSMNQPASQQCLHCVCLNVTDIFEHSNVCWNSYVSADKYTIVVKIHLKNTAEALNIQVETNWGY